MLPHGSSSLLLHERPRIQREIRSPEERLRADGAASTAWLRLCLRWGCGPHGCRGKEVRCQDPKLAALLRFGAPEAHAGARALCLARVGTCMHRLGTRALAFPWRAAKWDALFKFGSEFSV